MHKLEPREGNLLSDMMLAVRPDWARNRPRDVLLRANAEGFAQAHDFDHMVRALAHYATVRGRDGGYHFRTPDLFPDAGEHWTVTAPAGWSRVAGARCEEHPTFEADTCRCCHADIKAGMRPPGTVGRALSASEKGGRPISAEERERLREGLSRAAEGMPEDAGTMQETEKTA